MGGTEAAWMALGLTGMVHAAVLVVVLAAAIRIHRYPADRHLRVLVLPLALAASAHAGVVDVSAGLLDYVGKRWGEAAAGRVLDWRTHAALHGGDEAVDADMAHLAAANSFWNRVHYADDSEHWRVADYWATPVEMLASNGGDCEDYAFGKYFTLRAQGVAPARMRIAYVRAAGRAQGHMVLAYYKTPDADPLILDNLTDAILPASQRTDLQPVYSFNDDDLWTVQSARRAGAANQVRAWRELLDRMDKERTL